MKRSGSRTLLALSLFAMLAAACSAKPDEHAAHKTAGGDLQEKTASIQTLPAFLDKQDAKMKKVYQIAAGTAADLAYIPCYCGCGQSAGHGSNLNCFIKEIAKDGSVVWDDHATRCDVCLEIAVKTAQWKMEGKSLKDIRSTIDSQYGSGYAKPTPTPLPPV